MTNKEFIKVLNGEGYSYEQLNNKIVVTERERSRWDL
jgi:hypothetical protein